MSEIILGWSCDWCNGVLEPFPNAESKVRCRKCKRTKGNENAPYSTKNKMKTKKEIDVID